MANEIIRQGPGFTIYRTSDWGPPVPYPPVMHKDSINHGFVDLRDHPERAAQIPETRKSKGLEMILRVLAPSPLMSIGCEYRLNTRDGAGDGLGYYFHSYTDLTYRDPAQHASEQQMIDLAESLLREIEPRNGAVFGFEIAVQRMKCFFGKCGGYNLSLGLSGYGRTEEEASRSYEISAGQTAEAFTRLFAKAPVRR